MRRRVLALVLGMSMTVLAAPSPALAATTVPNIPFTGWIQPGPVAVDALGSWLAVAGDSVAGPGQAQPSWIHAMTFIFEHHSPGGIIGLATGPGGKTAVFGVFDDSGRLQQGAIPYNWVPGHYYFPMVAELGDGRIGGWVYDYPAGVLTPIGAVPEEVAWGSLASASVTYTAWTGATQDSCAKYPRADVYRFPTLGVALGGISRAYQSINATQGDGCISTTEAVGTEGWMHYAVGF